MAFILWHRAWFAVDATLSSPRLLPQPAGIVLARAAQRKYRGCSAATASASSAWRRVEARVRKPQKLVACSSDIEGFEGHRNGDAQRLLRDHLVRLWSYCRPAGRCAFSLDVSL